MMVPKLKFIKKTIGGNLNTKNTEVGAFKLLPQFLVYFNIYII